MGRLSSWPSASSPTKSNLAPGGRNRGEPPLPGLSASSKLGGLEPLAESYRPNRMAFPFASPGTLTQYGSTGIPTPPLNGYPWLNQQQNGSIERTYFVQSQKTQMPWVGFAKAVTALGQAGRFWGGRPFSVRHHPPRPNRALGNPCEPPIPCCYLVALPAYSPHLRPLLTPGWGTGSLKNFGRAYPAKLMGSSTTLRCAAAAPSQ
jgi:hypothetical protein